jgi:hypothetical protein
VCFDRQCIDSVSTIHFHYGQEDYFLLRTDRQLDGIQNAPNRELFLGHYRCFLFLKEVCRNEAEKMLRSGSESSHHRPLDQAGDIQKPSSLIQKRANALRGGQQSDSGSRHVATNSSSSGKSWNPAMSKTDRGNGSPMSEFRKKLMAVVRWSDLAQICEPDSA